MASRLDFNQVGWLIKIIMIEQLFGSKARLKILKLFLLHPEKRFYIRQVARDLKLQLNSVRRELENLEKFGILFSSLIAAADQEQAATIRKRGKRKSAVKPKHGRRYYQANQEFVLFDEIKALIVKAQILYEKDFINKLLKEGRPKLLILSGLFVNNHNSLVDLLVVGKYRKQRLAKIIKELENQLGKEINYTYLNLSEFNYRRNITDVFLYNILEGRKIVVFDEIGLS